MTKNAFLTFGILATNVFYIYATNNYSQINLEDLKTSS